MEAFVLIATLHSHLEPKVLALLAGMFIGVGFTVGRRWGKRNGNS